MIESKPLVFLPMACKPPKSQARISYVNLSAIYRSFTSTTQKQSSSQFQRSDFASQPFTGSYDAGEKTTGPLGDAAILGAPKYTPRALQQHLDNFVVGQEQAKKMLSVAVYNHYLRIQEIQRREAEEEELRQQHLRREMSNIHPLEGSLCGMS